MLLLLPSEHVQEGLRRQRQWQAAGEKEILHLLQLAHHHPSGQHHGPQSLLVMAHSIFHHSGNARRESICSKEAAVECGKNRRQ
jgi:hypothetical protein